MRTSDRARHFCNYVMMRRASPCVSGRTTAERPYRSELWRWWCTGTWDAWLGWGGERERGTSVQHPNVLYCHWSGISSWTNVKRSCAFTSVSPLSIAFHHVSAHTHTNILYSLLPFLALFLTVVPVWFLWLVIVEKDSKHVCFNLKLVNESDCFISLLECKHHTVQYSTLGLHTPTLVYIGIALTVPPTPVSYVTRVYLYTLAATRASLFLHVNIYTTTTTTVQSLVASLTKYTLCAFALLHIHVCICVHERLTRSLFALWYMDNYLISWLVAETGLYFVNLLPLCRRTFLVNVWHDAMRIVFVCKWKWVLACVHRAAGIAPRGILIVAHPTPAPTPPPRPPPLIRPVLTPHLFH